MCTIASPITNIGAAKTSDVALSHWPAWLPGFFSAEPSLVRVAEEDGARDEIAAAFISSYALEAAFR